MRPLFIPSHPTPRGLWCVAFVALMAAGCGESNLGEPPVVEGNARFTIITPTLIRLEYAEDGRFENRPTQTLGTTPPRETPYETWVEAGERVVQTSALTLRYRVDSGPFTPDNLRITHDGSGTEARPDWSDTTPDPEQLGGWLRSLDLVGGEVPTNPGVLTRRGWYLLDDTDTALIVRAEPGFVARPERTGAYQDGYFFGYGSDYPTALGDLRVLTGAAPLLPRRAYGVWFSRYWPYSSAEWQGVVETFRQRDVPLDTISLDTDWKAMPEENFCSVINGTAGGPPDADCSWNGWQWSPTLFPDPDGFMTWAHDRGLEVGLNIHPSINGADPGLALFDDIEGSLRNDLTCQLLQGDTSNRCYVFDWAEADQLEAYFALHEPIAEAGVDFWWLDWCCDDSYMRVPGLTPDTFINERYFEEHRRMDSRWPAFSRIGSATGSWGARPDAGEGMVGQGAFAEHRATLHFTGDTCSTWELIAFAAEFTAAEGAAIGMPYVSHDIGSFHGERAEGAPCELLPITPLLPDDMYVRWIQLGTFQPLDRLHSQHGRRLPWEYDPPIEDIAVDFLRLRERLVPYLYTLGREAHDTGMPLVRALYLQWPARDEAYTMRSNFTLGDGLFVATVAEPGADVSVSFWLPPGQWYDFFTDTPETGDTMVMRDLTLAEYPVYARAGTILPTQPDLPSSAEGPQDDLTLHVWAGADGSFRLYEDAGRGFEHEQGEYRFTRVTFTEDAGCRELTIGAAEGQAFEGALAARSWHVRLVGVDAPSAVQVGDDTLSGSGTPGYEYDAGRRVLVVHTGVRSAGEALTVSVGACG